MNRRDLLRGLLALLATPLLPKPLHRASRQRVLEVEERSGFRVVRTVPEPVMRYVMQPEPPYVIVTERWTRNDGNLIQRAYRIGNGPWIPVPVLDRCPLVIFDDNPQIGTYARATWVSPGEARLLGERFQ